MSISKLLVGAITVGCLCAAGCYVEPVGGVGVAVEPGPVEVAPPAPGPDAQFLWIPGWWDWSGGVRVWHGGYWGHRPHPGAVFVPHTWTRGPGGRMIHHGGEWH